MAKHHSRLPKEEVEKIFFKLCVALAETKDAQESAELLRDLLSYQEAEMIAKRLMIADMIIGNKTYQEIKDSLKVSFGTIARVQEWLKISGSGYRKAVQRVRKIGKEEVLKLNTEKQNSWSAIKRMYPSYFWPEILLQSIIQNSSKRQKEKLRRAISEMNKMKRKTKLFREIDRMLKSPKSRP